jgi:ferric-dicitrate binding protein FerR (iron transport regulator)
MPPFVSPPDEVLLGRYVAGRATDDERVRIAAWLDEDPRRHDLIDQIRQVWSVEPLDMVVSDAEVQRVWAAVRERTLSAAPTARVPIAHAPATDATPSHAVVTRGSSQSRRPHVFWRRVTLGVTGIMATALALLVVKPWAAERTRDQALEHITGRVYRTAAGQRATVRLPDGSVAILAPQTTVTVSHSFLDDARSVAVTGEAYFDVAPSSRTPFTVQTGVVRARVLGTQFTVSHYPDDRDVRVAVVSGKVAVAAMTSKRPSVILTAGTVGHVTDSTATAATVNDAQASAEWTQGHLRFYDTPVSEVLRVVGHWYGYEFRVTDSAMSARRVTTTLDGLTADQALNAIEHLLPATMTFDGHVISLHAIHPVKTNDRRRDVLSTPREVGR